MRPSTPRNELHVALVGQDGVGKSAVAVRYIAKRFIGEYDSTLEDTYCRQDTIQSQSVMVWLMDTVEAGSGTTANSLAPSSSGDSSGRDDMRWLTWADLYVVIYDITNAKSLQYAERLLDKIARHQHSLCPREHRTLLLGNKVDLERYRAVSETEARRLAGSHRALFAETSAAGDVRALTHVIHSALGEIIGKTRSPSPTRLCSSDSEIVGHTRKSGFSFRSSRLKESKISLLQKSPSVTKLNKTSKLLKLFHN